LAGGNTRLTNDRQANMPWRGGRDGWDQAVTDNRGLLVLRDDAILKGEVRNCRQMQIFGYVEGTIATDELIIHQGGRCYGTVRAGSADIAGAVQGDIFVKNLINIQSTGDVAGNVHYGHLAMQHGGSLSADLRNVPPTIAGDLQVQVYRGGSVIVTTADLTALDPDDTPDHLIYRITNVRNGHLAFMSKPAAPVDGFTQADLNAGQVMFVHDGTPASAASFDAVVADHTGATSGAAKTVSVAVVG
jgi:cytoskeletal protein CcmA (bactofilin family)